MSKNTVVIIEDSPGDGKYLKNVVGRIRVRIGQESEAMLLPELYEEPYKALHKLLANNGDKAKRTGCIILDMQIRGDDYAGLKFMDDLRKQELRRQFQIPVIVVTGIYPSLKEHLVDGRIAPFQVIRKPENPVLLVGPPQNAKGPLLEFNFVLGEAVKTACFVSNELLTEPTGLRLLAVASPHSSFRRAIIQIIAGNNYSLKQKFVATLLLIIAAVGFAIIPVILK